MKQFHGLGATAPLTAADFRRLTGATAEIMDRLATYLALLQKWQRRINLVAASTLADPWRRHMLDSAQLVPLLGTPAVAPAATAPIRVADLGSGAGFPGLVLAVMGAGAISLVESDSRKCAFLREAIRATAAQATVETARIESLPSLAADVVTARACAPLPRLIGYAARHLRPDSDASGGVCLLLKGRSAAAELTRARETWNMSARLVDSISDPSGVVIRLEAIRPR